MLLKPNLTQDASRVYVRLVMQVYSSVAYSTGGHDFPLLGVSAMAMGRVRVLALDLQPLFSGLEYAAKYADANAKMKAIKEKYPQMGQVIF